MTDGQIDQLWNLINALNDRIADLERETAELRYQVNYVEYSVDNLKWGNDNGY